MSKSDDDLCREACWPDKISLEEFIDTVLKDNKTIDAFYRNLKHLKKFDDLHFPEWWMGVYIDWMEFPKDESR